VIEISSDEEEEDEEESEAEEEAEIEQDNGSEAWSGVEGEQDDERDAREESELRDEQDNDSEPESSVDNEFEGFDVKPEDKEFFDDLLQAAPPEAVMELTGKTRRVTSQASSGSSSDLKKTKRPKIFAEVEALSDIAADTKRIKRVKLFAEDHPFRHKDMWTGDELQEYEDDVYEFAKAAGFSDVQAGVEVGKAVGVWKTERGIKLPSELFMDTPSEIKPPIPGKLSKEDKERRKAEKKARRKLKRDAGQSSRASSSAISQTQIQESAPTPGKLSKEDKARRKAEKKARHKLSRNAAQSSRATSSAISETKVSELQNIQTLKGPNLQSSQSYYVAEERLGSAAETSSRDELALSAADEKSVGFALKEKRKEKAEKRRLRKMAKLGPKKSEYFSNAVSDPAPKPKNVGDSMSRQQEKKQIKEAKQLSAKKEKDEQDQIKQMAREAKQAVNKAPVLVKQTPAKTKEQDVPATTTIEPELAKNEKKTRRQKKNRNKNKLPEDQPGHHETSSVIVEGNESESMQKKRRHDGSPTSNLAHNTGKEGKIALSSFKKLVVENGASFSSQRAFSQSGPDAATETHRPAKPRDQGKRELKAKNEGLKMPHASEATIAKPVIPASDHLFESIETNETASQRKRKRRKAKSGEVSMIANVAALTEVTNSQELHEDRPHNHKRRALSADALVAAARPSVQSSKVHHSQ
jgi:hypothetical protein